MLLLRGAWGNVARMGENQETRMLLTRKPDGNRLLGRPIYRWKTNTKINYQGTMGGCRLDLYDSGEGRFVVYCERSNERSISVTCREFFF